MTYYRSSYSFFSQKWAIDLQKQLSSRITGTNRYRRSLLTFIAVLKKRPMMSDVGMRKFETCQ